VRGVFPRPYAISHLPHRDLSMQSVEEKGRLGGLLGGGDFSLYQGVWRMQPLPNCVRSAASGGGGATGGVLTSASRLSYAVELRPALPVPVRCLYKERYPSKCVCVCVILCALTLTINTPASRCKPAI
jgi:hypothetical protein